MITRGRTALALIAFAVVLTLPGTARPAAAPGAVAPTPGAVNVTSFGAKPNDTADDTAGFKAAIAKAATQPIYAAGPSGKPQGVVYVPAGTYRVCGVRPLSNVRIEFDAGATMQLGKVTCGSPTILSLDGGTSNVSLVGVGTSTAGKPAAAAGWDISHSFRINADPAATGASPQVRGIAVRWTTDALIQNVFTVQNDSRQANNRNTAYTSTSPALTFYGLPTSTAGSPQIPRRVMLANLYNIKSPVSYGAVQVSACVDCTFDGLFSQGGVTLRLETDAEEAYYLKNHKHYYSIVDRLNGSDIESLNGRQAVTMSPALAEERRCHDRRCRHGQLGGRGAHQLGAAGRTPARHVLVGVVGLGHHRDGGHAGADPDGGERRLDARQVADGGGRLRWPVHGAVVERALRRAAQRHALHALIGLRSARRPRRIHGRRRQSIEEMAAEERELHERSKLGELEHEAKERLHHLRERLDHAHKVLKEREVNSEGTMSIDDARRQGGSMPQYLE